MLLLLTEQPEAWSVSRVESGYERKKKKESCHQGKLNVTVAQHLPSALNGLNSNSPMVSAWDQWKF